MVPARPDEGLRSTAGAADVAVRGHIVEFYAGDDELVVDVVAHLATALESGGTAVALATEAHRAAVVAGLAKAEIGPASLDRLRILDAEETLQRFLVDGEPNADRFAEVVGEVIGSSKPPVHAYGEMVALLWADGRVREAIDLESMWNGVGERYPFVLLCGYPVEACLWDEQAHELSRVCELHGSVAGSVAPLPAFRAAGTDEVAETERLLSLPREGSSVRTPRAVVGEVFGGSSAVERAAAELVVSELVTNAVEHGSGEVLVHFVVRARSVLTSVSDDGPIEPTGGKANARSPRRRGLQIVGALASGWGVTPRPGGGKVVWAQLQRGEAAS